MNHKHWGLHRSRLDNCYHRLYKIKKSFVSFRNWVRMHVFPLRKADEIQVRQPLLSHVSQGGLQSNRTTFHPERLAFISIYQHSNLRQEQPAKCTKCKKRDLCRYMLHNYYHSLIMKILWVQGKKKNKNTETLSRVQISSGYTRQRVRS